MRQALIEFRREQNAPRFNLQANYEMPPEALKPIRSGPKMNYLHDVIGGPGSNRLIINKRAQEILLRLGSSMQASQGESETDPSEGYDTLLQLPEL